MTTNPIAVSTWSLHRTLGVSYRNGPDHTGPFVKEETWGPGTLSVLDVPKALAAHGYLRCELCHFHVASLDERHLTSLRQSFADAGVILQALLIDAGDITDKTTRSRDLDWIAKWIDASVILGAETARVIGGKAKPGSQSLALSVEGLSAMVQHARKSGARITTENWFDTLSTPEAVHHVLDAVGPDLGFLADTGNWGGPTKFDDLKSIFARAQFSHFKPILYDRGDINMPDFDICIGSAQAANYVGPYTLIYDKGGDEWAGLERQRRAIRDRASG